VERSRRDLLLEPDQLVSVVTRRFAAGGEADLQEVLVREEDGDCSIVAFADDADLNVAHTAKLRNRTEGWNRITRPGTPAYGTEQLRRACATHLAQGSTSPVRTARW